MSWRASSNLAWLRSLPAVLEDHPLARHTSFNIGGPADFFVETVDPAPLLRGARERAIPARVFGAGTIQWAWGLDGTHDRGTPSPDARVQQATVNLLADMGTRYSAARQLLLHAARTLDSGERCDLEAGMAKLFASEAAM